MKAISIICLNIIVLLSLYLFTFDKDQLHFKKALLSKKKISFDRDYSENEEKETYDNPDYIRKYFDIWFKGYGKITPELMKGWSLEKDKLPEDNSSTNFWIQWGPVGQYIPGSSPNKFYSGRIVDIEKTDSTLRIAAASGGIWNYVSSSYAYPITNNISSTINIGSFCSQPNNSNIILVGTGEPRTNLWGTGLYRTTNNGVNYTNILLTPNPSEFYKIRFANGSIARVYAATDRGFFKSINGGFNWSRKDTGIVTDFAIDPTDIDVVYAAIWNNGLYKSTNGGDNFYKLTSGIPVTNFGRTTIAISPSNTNKVYVNIARNDNDRTYGVYRTTNGGINWNLYGSATDFHGNQGWYNSAIAVDPANQDRVIVGGVKLIDINPNSTTEISNVHADQHFILWKNDGVIRVGNDGGLCRSFDNGNSFNHDDLNRLPITQFVTFDVERLGNYCFGGSQDNGISGTNNRGVNWFHFKSGDGGGMAIDPNTPNKVMATLGVYSGDWTFRNVITYDEGFNWTVKNNGIDPSTQWYTRVRSDKGNPAKLYHNSGKFVYESTNDGENWNKLNQIPFGGDYVSNISVTIPTFPKAIIYACIIDSVPSTTDILKVYTNNAWFERSSGLPAGKYIRTVRPALNTENTAYALTNGYSPGAKIFKTTNRGINWRNISGDIPDIPLSDIIPHPTDSNKLYLGSYLGFFRSTNAGNTWQRWNFGLPEAVQISDLSYIDSVSVNGRFYIVAATYGRSIFYREISGDDPISISNNQNEVPLKFILSQNYPNPFNPSTNIKFAIPKSGFVKLTIFDMLGREVETLVNENLNAGTFNADWNALKYSSGVYFYKLQAGEFSETKKMIFIK